MRQRRGIRLSQEVDFWHLIYYSRTIRKRLKCRKWIADLTLKVGPDTIKMPAVIQMARVHQRLQRLLLSLDCLKLLKRDTSRQHHLNLSMLLKIWILLRVKLYRKRSKSILMTN